MQNVKRFYTISGSKDFVDNIECLFSIMNSLGAVGSSRKIELFIDGDGAYNIKIERQDKKKLNTIVKGYGELLEITETKKKLLKKVEDYQDGSFDFDLG